MIGVITGRQIFTNRDGVQLRTMLQVELGMGDVKTVELIGTTGDDTNPPDGARVVVFEVADSYLVGIAMTDDIMPEVDPGERELYSIDTTGLLKMGRCRFYANGDVIISSTNGATSQAKINILDDGQIIIEQILTGASLIIDSLGNIILNSGTLPVARQTDQTISTAADDAAFWLWLGQAAAVLAGLGVVAPPPTQLMGQIFGGNPVVLS